jgi:nitroreductase
MAASVFPAVQNLLLAAHALGLGSTLTTLPVVAGDELSERLGLPGEVIPVAVVPLGHVPKPLGPPRRRPLSEKAHLDRYGNPFP